MTLFPQGSKFIISIEHIHKLLNLSNHIDILIAYRKTHLGFEGEGNRGHS